MPTAYVLIKVVAGAEAKVFEALSKIEGVEEVNVVYGEYDIIAKVNARSMDDLRNIVVKQIRGVRGIVKTETAIITVSSIKYPTKEKLG
ncbi:MAG: Lrp/AsnC family transcriptional regulator [Thaumarchaeota archaeon]|nr:Lrp/AsnC family transcriptional regulator [Nitrososphaerota archaeon]